MSAYDQVSYINSPYAQTHPSRLFVMARLAGLDPPAVETCRVLEIGASEGENLTGMAVVLPSAEFLGIELAEVPVARGQKTIADLALGNVRLRQMNLLDVDEGLGKFDYIIVHGMYSWTPPVVRDKILAVARAHLTAQGVAFVSYNTLPAGHVRKMMREMMLYHIGGETDPGARLEKARELLRLLQMGRPEASALETAVAAQATELLGRTDSALYHDDLSEVYEPVYFHEFAAHAARHNLQYMGEASLPDSMPRNLKAEAIERIREIAGDDRLAGQQYFDFARTKKFRQTLLCHAENTLSEGNAEGCYASAGALEREDGAFVSSADTRMSTKHPAPVAYMRRLIGLWPCSERVSPDDAALALELYRVGMIELHGFAGVARKAGERPSVSRFARYQAARGDSRVTTLGHRTLQLSDEESKKSVILMDGSRDRAELAREMGCSRERLDTGLEALSRHELFTG
jgi:cyclopropane fatty-acyl-phospholipid synthase-like methyltransferase